MFFWMKALAARIAGIEPFSSHATVLTQLHDNKH